MSRSELFNVFNVVIGLIANIIGITTFIAGLWSGNVAIIGSIEVLFIYKLVSAVLIIYSWLYISYLLAARKIRHLPDYFEEEYEERRYISEPTIMGNYVRPIYVTRSRIVDGVKESTLESIAARATTSVGVPLFPMTFLWWHLVLETGWQTVGLLIMAILCHVSLGLIISYTIVALIPIIFTDLDVKWKKRWETLQNITLPTYLTLPLSTN